MKFRNFRRLFKFFSRALEQTCPRNFLWKFIWHRFFRIWQFQFLTEMFLIVTKNDYFSVYKSDYFEYGFCLNLRSFQNFNGLNKKSADTLVRIRFREVVSDSWSYPCPGPPISVLMFGVQAKLTSLHSYKRSSSNDYLF